MNISCWFEISFRSNLLTWNPYQFEFHFVLIHLNTSKELTEHRSEIFNKNEISYRFEFISPHVKAHFRKKYHRKKQSGRQTWWCSCLLHYIPPPIFWQGVYSWWKLPLFCYSLFVSTINVYITIFTQLLHEIWCKWVKWK